MNKPIVSPHSTGLQPDPKVVQSLRNSGTLKDGESATFEALRGGVSSDIWKVTTDSNVFCVKKALAKLRVDADWFAPVERNRFEVSWLKAADNIVSGAAPKVIAHDDKEMLCTMEYLDPASHKLWKSELRNGRADPVDAASVGRRLGGIHAGSVGDKAIEALFPINEIFQAIRLEPYLEATAAKHPDLKDQLFALSRRTGETRHVMVHGDVSPKNILLGSAGPVFLDAECACIGDPAFDLSFCLNHFLLKCLWVPDTRDDFLACYEAMAAHYLAEVDWEQVDALEARAARLLPGLFLARVDGKSPVEYITEEVDKNHVRTCARRLLAAPPTRLADVADAWKRELLD